MKSLDSDLVPDLAIDVGRRLTTANGREMQCVLIGTSFDSDDVEVGIYGMTRDEVIDLLLAVLASMATGGDPASH